MPNEYLNLHLNKSIMCPKCHRPFRAREVGVPVKIEAASFSWSSPPAAAGYKLSCCQWIFCFRCEDPYSFKFSTVQSGYSGFGSTVRMVNELAAKGESSSQENIHGNEKGVLREENATIVVSNKPRSSGELSNLGIHSMLVKKARMEITKKLKEWSTNATSQTSSEKEKEEANCS
ncbi:hypothetical protein EJD97_025356 [Solanum chilense]|uniref:Uncharacterized protein n=1 Tax=Solanum chilense TaxID=4083 RepID=A0A6N2C5Y0_SOLCI|nr:hypothetical protein EJD97_025356 [Solanum chilense]